MKLPVKQRLERFHSRWKRSRAFFDAIGKRLVRRRCIPGRTGHGRHPHGTALDSRRKPGWHPP